MATQTKIVQQTDTTPIYPKSIGHYVFGKTLGEGTFGKVKVATHILTGEKVAIKILEKSKILDKSDIERVTREIQILKMIRHPHVIQLYEIIETPKQLFLVMEYAVGGELFDYIVQNQRIKDLEAARFFNQIISGIEYIHKNNVVHRDMKPENLLIDRKNKLKIVDFGLSNTYKHQEDLLKTACGSPCYAAPEMIAGKKYNGLQVDIWSCGVILFAMLCGYLPFEDPNTSLLYKKILGGEYKIPKFVSPEGNDLISNILNTNPSKRFSIEDIRKHPWFNLYRLTKIPQGIVIGNNKVPVDQSILASLVQFGYNLEYAQKCIESNRHNHVTTTYYLLLKKYLNNGGKSNSDIGSDLFVPELIDAKPQLNILIAQNTKLIHKLEGTGGSSSKEKKEIEQTTYSKSLTTNNKIPVESQNIWMNFDRTPNGIFQETINMRQSKLKGNDLVNQSQTNQVNPLPQLKISSGKVKLNETETQKVKVYSHSNERQYAQRNKQSQFNTQNNSIINSPRSNQIVNNSADVTKRTQQPNNQFLNSLNQILNKPIEQSAIKTYKLNRNDKMKPYYQNFNTTQVIENNDGNKNLQFIGETQNNFLHQLYLKGKIKTPIIAVAQRKRGYSQQEGVNRLQKRFVAQQNRGKSTEPFDDESEQKYITVLNTSTKSNQNREIDFQSRASPTVDSIGVRSYLMPAQLKLMNKGWKKGE